MSDYRSESDSEDEDWESKSKSGNGKRKAQPSKVDTKRQKPSDLRAVVEANEKFSNDLLKLLSGKGNSASKGNTVISPISLSTILALMKTGASGISDKELGAALNLPFDSETINRGYKELLSPFEVDHNRNKGTNSLALLSMNRIFVDKRYKLKEKFVESAKTNFYAGVESLDFSRRRDTVTEINKRVGDSTNKKITNLVTEDHFNAMTAVVLVNALYLKGKWSQPFNEHATNKMPFHVSKDKQKQVKMMHITKPAKMFYTAERKLKAEVLRLDYETKCPKEQKYSMLVYLPKKESSLENLKACLNDTDVASVMKNLKETMVTVSMPRLKINISHQLVPVLKQMGLKSIFSEQTAELKGIGEDKFGLYITDVIQQVYIAVNEKGTEAAAATAASAGRRRASTPPPKPKICFNVDRPFLFQIVNRESHLVLFSGVCTNPQ